MFLWIKKIKRNWKNKSTTCSIDKIKDNINSILKEIEQLLDKYNFSEDELKLLNYIKNDAENSLCVLMIFPK